MSYNEIQRAVEDLYKSVEIIARQDLRDFMWNVEKNYSFFDTSDFDLRLKEMEKEGLVQSEIRSGRLFWKPTERCKNTQYLVESMAKFADATEEEMMFTLCDLYNKGHLKSYFDIKKLSRTNFLKIYSEVKGRHEKD